MKYSLRTCIKVGKRILFSELGFKRGEKHPQYETYGLASGPKGWCVVRVRLQGKKPLSVSRVFGPSTKSACKLKIKSLILKYLKGLE